MIHCKGDAVEQLKNGDIDVLFHQVNCRGRMGSGIAKQIREEFPEHYDDYMNAYINGEAVLGKYICTAVAPFKMVVGVFSQGDYGYNGNQFTDYSAICSGFEAFFMKCDDKVINSGLMKFAVPKLYGCGLGGGDWNIVSEIFEDLEKNHNVTIHCIEYSK